MDSKLKAKVIVAVTLMVCLILGTVLVANYMQTGAFPGQRQTVDASLETNQSETAAVDANSQNMYAALNEQYHLDPNRDPYAFLEDPDFFDEEVVEADPATQLSLLVSSATKDIRVNVVDGNGELVKDQRFEVILKRADGADTYRDVDKDGSIYIAELSAGNYTVTLQEMDNFQITGNDVPVQVKEQVEYTILEDVSYLVKTEDEIDPSVDDTAVKEAEADADGTESNQKLSEDEAILGIDVSKWNKEIDWEKVKADGVEFAIIRCGYRGSKTGSLVEDPYFQKNIEGATKAGIKVGIYFFTQATTQVEAVEEASMVLMLCRGYKIAYPMYIDTEGAGGNGRADSLEMDARTSVVKAFCETIENSGFNAGIYASKNWFEHNLDTSALKGYQNWLAQYSNRPSYEGDYSMWQYTSAGTVDGINGRVDLNLSYMEY